MMDERSWASKIGEEDDKSSWRWCVGRKGRDGSDICQLGSMADGLVQINDGGREKLRVEMERKSEERDGRIEMKEKEEKK